MRPPEDDVERRAEVWDLLQMLYMDTDPPGLLEQIADGCARSPYSLAELEAILFSEVLPACRFNLFLLPAPAWAGFERSWLIRRILAKHRFGRRRPLLLRRYTARWWRRLAPMIEQRRAAAPHES